MKPWLADYNGGCNRWVARSFDDVHRVCFAT